MIKLKVGSLFSGIGGLELGLEWAGMQVAWQVEYDSYCQKVLSERWPDVKRYGDIYTVKGTELEWVDVICGGFPCQPFSHAGKRKGTEDSRWLWPEFYRIVREVKPRWVVVENVPGLLTIDSGRVFASILRDLAEIGYDAEWQSVRASDVGARHRRERLFIVAHANNAGNGTPRSGTDGNGKKENERWQELSFFGSGRCREIIAYLRQRNTGPGGIWEYDPADVVHPRLLGQAVSEVEATGVEQSSSRCGSDPASIRSGTRGAECEGQQRSGASIQPSPDIHNPLRGRYTPQEKEIRTRGNGLKHTGARPASPGMGIVADGIPGAVDYGYQARVGHKIPDRVNRLKCLGNAVVPQVSEYVGLCIMKVQSIISKGDEIDGQQ